MKYLLKRAALLATFILCANDLSAGDWPRFRGPNGTGKSSDSKSLPGQIDVDKSLVWKVSAPNGISSPIVAGGHVYLTGHTAEGKLLTVAYQEKTGQIAWQKSATAKVDASGKRRKAQRPSASTPTSDGDLIFNFFEATGLQCRNRDGRLIWEKQLGSIVNQFNHTSSPILIDNKVVLVVDHDGDSFVTALDKLSGDEVWRSERFLLGRNYSSPIVWQMGSQRFVVVAGSGWIVGYEVNSGKPTWYSKSTSAVVNPTPIVGDNGWLYVHGSSPPSGAKSSPFASTVKKLDQNKDSKLQRAELPNCLLNLFFEQLDTDHDQAIDKNEYASFRILSQPFTKGLSAIKPPATASGHLGEQLTWRAEKSMPRTPSAVYYKNTLFIVSEGGVLQSINARSGKLIKKGRISARGTIYSSPSLGDGKLYIGTRNGEVSVVKAIPEWEEIHTAKIGEDIQASPAIANGRVIFRTKHTLLGFGLQ